ncbi:molybdenum cofactor guanylyltransferase MobA [Sneathiella marina]|uniref:Molybdenum cofactor guanylyltransferase n=1 Tax=Sneathiella marina TaxID=2950108 RepID=A0ABY4W088_9PROT|nr:molybdenum cofactor guanylyltransferase MobA [Sneathiella marina]USG60540.1 molybdenum cofactor guanylyltransferase MobA [Sneathiella marina]
MTAPDQLFPAVLLAGGQSRRMGGGSKFLQEIAGQSLLTRIVSTVTPQVSDLILNININPEVIENIKIPTVKDSVEGFAGPLSGILTGLEYYINMGSKASHMLSVPTDAPFIPEDLVSRLRTGLGDLPEKTIVMAESVGRVHPVIALWPLSLAADLRIALVEEDLRKILVFADRYNRVNVVWGDHEGDPFFNINRPEDLEEAKKRLA